MTYIYRMYILVVLLTLSLLLQACTATVSDDALIGNLSSIEISSNVSADINTQTVAKTRELRLRATGGYSHTPNKTNLTTAVVWQSQNPDVVLVSNAKDAEGLLSAVGVGTAIVTATVPRSGVIGQIEITVEPAPLVSLTISPDAYSMPRGNNVQYSVMGRLNDGSDVDYTDRVKWIIGAFAADEVTADALANDSIANKCAANQTPLSGFANPDAEKAKVDTIATLGNEADSKGFAWAVPLAANDPAWSSDAGSCVKVVATFEDPITGLIVDINALNVRPAELLGLDVSPASLILNPNTISGQQYRANALFTDGRSIDYTTSALWEVSNLNLAEFPSTGPIGYLSSMASGAVTVTATGTILETNETVSGTAQLEITESDLARIDITPVHATLNYDGNLPLDTTLSLKGTGVYNDGLTHNLTQWLDWTSSDPGILSIETVATGQRGVVTAHTVGNVIITAATPLSYAGLAATGQTTITVTPLSLEKITLGVNVAVAKGGTARVNATGTYGTDPNNLQTQVVNELLEWDVLPTGDGIDYLTVSNDPGSKGIVTGITQTPQGIKVSVRARAFDVNGDPLMTHPSDGTTGVPVEAIALVTVDDPRIIGYELLPPTQTIAKNTQQRYILEGIFTDGSRQNLTGSFKTRLYLDSVVTSAKMVGKEAIECPGGTKYFFNDIGVVRAYSPSFIRVHGYYDSPRRTAHADLVITAAQLDSLTIAPKDSALNGVELPVGAVRQYTAMGHFDDGTIQDLTDQILWSVDQPAIASVENRDPYDAVCNNKPLAVSGRVTGVAAGNVNIIATDPITGINTSAEITGSSASLTICDDVSVICP